MSIIVALELGFSATIAALTWRSMHRDGFVTVHYAAITSISDAFSDKLGESQFRWTLVPAITISLFSLGYAATVAATAERQPFVELYGQLKHRKDSKNAKLTILLDYPSQANFYSWYIAIFLNHHFLLGAGILLQVIVSIFIVPLTSNLFRAKPSQHASLIDLVSPSELNVSTLRLATDLQPAMDIASAVHAYGASPPAWMTTEYAIESFSPVEDGKTGRIIVKTSVYSATVNCRSVPRAEMNIHLDGSDAARVGNNLINFVDRGCSVINQGFAVSPDTPRFALTWNQKCSGTDASQDRIGVFIGTYSEINPDRLGELVTVSCIPSYYQWTASVRMQFDDAKDPQVIDVDPQAKAEIFSDNFRAFHSTITLYQTYDASNSFKSDAFGRTVFYYAQKLNTASSVNHTSIVEATRTVYKTLFAALAQSQLMARRDIPEQLYGQLLQSRTRLYVVAPVAYAMITLLALMLICSIGIFVVATTVKTGLKEEPIGLFGRAAVLLKSEVFTLVEDVRRDHAGEKSLVKVLKKRYTIEKSRCFFEREPGTDNHVLKVRDLSPKPIVTRWARVKKRLAPFWAMISKPFKKLGLVWKKRRERNQAIRLKNLAQRDAGRQAA